MLGSTLEEAMYFFLFFVVFSLQSQRSHQGQSGPAAPITEHNWADYRARWRWWHQPPEVGWLYVVSVWKRPAQWRNRMNRVNWAHGNVGSRWVFLTGLNGQPDTIDRRFPKFKSTWVRANRKHLETGGSPMNLLSAKFRADQSLFFLLFFAWFK